MRKILLVAVVFALFALPAAASAQDAAPLWHCDTVRVDAASPGYNVTATGAATYSETVLLPEPSGAYTLTLWNGAGLVDTEAATLGSCVPTAVRVSKFAAYSHLHPFNGWRVWRVEIMTRGDE